MPLMRKAGVSMKWNSDILNKKVVSLVIGEVIHVEDEEELFYVLEILRTLLNAEFENVDVITRSVMYYEKGSYKGFYVNLACVDTMLLLAIIPIDQQVPDRLDHPDGVLGYVYNVTNPMLSELGYLFFKEENGIFIRR